MSVASTIGRAARAARSYRGAILPPLVLIALVLAVSVRSPNFTSLPSLQVIAFSAAVLALLAGGQLLLILLGRIDLSTGALAAFGTVLLAQWVPHLGAWAIPATLGCLAAAGVVTGIVHVYSQVASFIVTLGALGIWAGVSLVVSGAKAIPVEHGYNSVAWATGFTGWMPHEVIVAGCCLLVLAVALRATHYGRGVYATGLAEPAARMSGVNVSLIIVSAFALSGLFSGLTSVVLVAQQFSGDPSAAQSLLLPSIAAVIVGGNAITGGSGGISRLVIGALIIAVLRNGLGLVGIDPAYDNVAFGGAIIIAAALTSDRSRLTTVK